MVEITVIFELLPINLFFVQEVLSQHKSVLPF